ncbi:MAG: SDR family oxidoreductase [Solirubrobacteraceae bacterium]
MPDERPLTGEVAVVTGALGNLGPHWVESLLSAGAAVLALDLRDEGAAELEARVGERGGGFRFEQADVTERDSLGRARGAAAAFGTPSVLVNNAGIDQPPSAHAERFSIEEIPSEVFRATVETNLLGVFHAMQVFGAPMAEAGRGSIVNIGSLYARMAPEPLLYDHMPGDTPFLKPPAYGASKAGVVNLTRYFARLWGPRGVRVNSLSPGGVKGAQDGEFVRKYCSRVPLSRMAEPSDLTGPLLFLASDASRYMTGQDLRVDGGFDV